VSAEDAELVARVQRGESQAYAELVRRYQDRVFNACWRICGHLEDARDLTQEAFLKAFEGLGSFRGESGFFTWIFRVAVNLALTHRRNSHRRRMISLDQASNSGGTQAEELARHVRSENTERDVGPARGELHAAVIRALHDLDEDQRAVLVLRDIEGFDYQDIGAILRIPPGTVKSRLFRARAAVQRAIAAADPPMSDLGSDGRVK
jgi:RNA polymerase sigma-70 factor (ECF subfamily)